MITYGTMRRPGKIRFNLGRGENYRKWKVKFDDGEVFHYDPKKVTITLRESFLKCNEEGAKKIYNGSNKFICAWIEFEEIGIHSPFLPIGKIHQEDVNCLGGPEVSFNPKKAPYWRVLASRALFKNQNCNGYVIMNMYTVGNKVVYGKPGGEENWKGCG